MFTESWKGWEKLSWGVCVKDTESETKCNFSKPIQTTAYRFHILYKRYRYKPQVWGLCECVIELCKWLYRNAARFTIEVVTLIITHPPQIRSLSQVMSFSLWVSVCVYVHATDALNMCRKVKTNGSRCVTVINHAVTEGNSRAALSLRCWWFMSVVLHILLSVTHSHTSLCRLLHTCCNIIIWCQRQKIPTAFNLANSSFIALADSNTFSSTAGIRHEKML